MGPLIISAAPLLLFRNQLKIQLPFVFVGAEEFYFYFIA